MNKKLLEMSRKNNRERLEGREEEEDGVQHPPATTVRAVVVERWPR